MTQHLADLGQRGASPEHLRRRGVPQPVRGDLAQPGPSAGGDHDVGHTARAQRPVRRLDPHEHAAALRAPSTPATQIAGDRLADVIGQRQPLLPVALAADHDLARPPAEVTELQARHLTAA